MTALSETGVTSPLVIRTVLDLEVGDILRDLVRDVVVTRLIPESRQEAERLGYREVQSLGSSWTFDSIEPISATPSEGRLERHVQQMRGAV